MRNTSTNSEIIPFFWEENVVRVIKDSENTPWFVGKDVAGVLGYTNPQKAIRDHCKRAVSVEESGIATQGSRNSFTLGERIVHPPLAPQTKIIPEPDIYRLVARSQLPEAEKFEEWIFEEVLPSIRKTGSYQMPGADENKVFSFYFGDRLVRVVKAPGKKNFFMAGDITGALGYVDMSEALLMHCKGPRITIPIQTHGGKQEVRVIDESDVYDLIKKSTIPEAKRFEIWMLEEVLPAIPKQWNYAEPEIPPENFKQSKNMYFAMAKLVESADESLGGVVALRALNYFTGMPVEDLIEKIETQRIEDDMDFESGENIKEQMESFLSQRCEFSPAYKTPASDLYQAYTQWCKDLNIGAQLSCKRFGMELSARFKKLKSGVIYYFGLRLIAKERGTN